MRCLLAFLLAISLALWQSPGFSMIGEEAAKEAKQAKQGKEGQMEYVPGEVIVKLKEGKTLDDLKGLNTKYGVLSAELVFKEMSGRAKESPPSSLDRIYLLKAAATADIMAMVATYQAHPAVEYAEPNYMVEIQKEASSLSTQ